jgi:hypothetical protein
MNRIIFLMGAVGLVWTLSLTGDPAKAWEAGPCDFITGGGFIVRDSGAKANFGNAGGCKHGSPTWGHLNYVDHGTGLHVRSHTITGYFFVDNFGPDPKTRQPRGSRIICGRAETNQYGDVDFAMLKIDKGEPGVDDEFRLRLTQGGMTVYTTEFDSNYTLGGSGPGGGNEQLHKPNPSTSGDFGGTCAAYPEIEAS